MLGSTDGWKESAMRKRGRMLGCLLTMAVMLTACGSADMESAGTAGGRAVQNDSVYFAEATELAAEEYDELAEAEYDTGADTGQTEQMPEGGRKLIRTASLEVETENYDLLLANIEQQVAQLGGYIEDISSYSGNNYVSVQEKDAFRDRCASITARIPQQRLDEFLDGIGEEANVIGRSESTEDVTLQYVDLESHKKALQTEQERLLKFMEQAETVEDLITIESRLSEVRYQLESMESQLRSYDNRIDYSTVYMSVNEVEKYTPPADVSVGERIRDGFLESLSGVGEGIADLGISFVIYLPYIVVWAAVLAAAVLIFRRIRRKRKNRSNKSAEQDEKLWKTKNIKQDSQP